MKQKVSIIVPVYNVEKYLDRCMESLLNQTLKDIEIILVDDGSPDNCPQMCDEYAKKDSRVKVVHKANAGLGYARTSGLEVATGEYVAFVDSDDYVDLDAYQTMYNEAVRENADYVCCGYKRIAHGKCVWEYRGIPKNKIQTIKEQDCYKILAGMLCDNKSQGLYRHYDFAVWHGYQLHKFLHQGNRQVIYTIKPCILKHFQRRTLAAAAHSGHNYKSHSYSHPRNKTSVSRFTLNLS